MKKRLIFSAIPVCLLVLGLVLVGCSTDGGDGDVKLPNNLQNTKWTQSDNATIEFKTDQILLNRYGNLRTFNVVSAAENGRITATEVYDGGESDPDEFCSSYTISGTTLTLEGERSFSGTWTKEASNNNDNDNNNNKGKSLVGSWEKGYNTLTFTDKTWKFLFGDESGTYTLSGTALTMIDSDGTSYKGTVTFGDSAVTFSGFTGMLGDEGFALNDTWTKKE